MKIGFIGAGNVGTSLGKLFAQRGVSVTGYFSRTRRHAEEAAEFTRTHCFDTLEEIVQASDTLFVTTSDGVVARMWNDMKTLPIKSKCICHCSGALPSSVFEGAAQWGTQLLEQCGFTQEQALTALTPLMRGNMQAICDKGAQNALTGPAERGDMGTIQSHMACLTREEQALYARLTRRLCDIAHKKHPDRDDTALTKYLEGLS